MTKSRKIYDLIKELLTDYPELRDSDKKLRWNIWSRSGFIRGTRVLAGSPFSFITEEDYMKAPNDETIRRCRQKIQELHPELRSSKFVQDKKELIERQRGTHIFREQIRFY
jgi:hypothetical protein